MKKPVVTYATPKEIEAFEKLPPPGRSFLSHCAIKYFLSQGDIVMHPYDEKCIGSNGIDVALGANMWGEVPTVAGGRRVLNPFDFEEVKQHWTRIAPITAGEYMEKHGPLRGIDRDAMIFVIEPGVMYLAHTEQFIGGRNRIATDMHARSSVGRNGLAVCKCADQGGVGFFNRWTMEITNHLGCAVILVVGMRIAQISFNLVDPVGEAANYVGSHGKYQLSNDLDEIVRGWKFEDVLPRLDKDREAQTGFRPSRQLSLLK